jgi:2-dehydro-3-deoxyphosphooctonate aldolase (KDO 8-P synthase)
MDRQGLLPVAGFEVGGVSVGLPGRPFLVAGPCVLQDAAVALAIATRCAASAARHGFGFAFKGSFDKANRTSVDSFRGPGLEAGLRILAAVREALGVPVVTDVHETGQVDRVAEVVDILQIPAFLCRQTDLVVAAARTGKALNVKKGQFLSPAEMAPVVGKAASVGNGRVILTERGTFFGYGRLVNDFSGMVAMRRIGHPVLYDVTHSVQKPGGLGDKSGGDRQAAFPLARAAAAAGCDGFFIEVYPEPDEAPSDAASSLDFDQFDLLLRECAPLFGAAWDEGAIG